MPIYKLEISDMDKIKPLFKDVRDTLVWSCLQGHMGDAWITEDGKSAQIITADFCFFAGEPTLELVKHCPAEYSSDDIIMIPENEAWQKLIESYYGENANKFTRYAIKHKETPFDTAKLSSYIEAIKPPYEVKLFDEGIYAESKENSWSEDLCAQFDTYDAFKNRGLGVAALYSDKLVAGATSYTVYDGGIEIEIDTQTEHRRRGLALACGAKLILECINKKIYPSWDAANKGSVALAEKLGYEFSHEYTAYDIRDFGKV